MDDQAHGRRQAGRRLLDDRPRDGDARPASTDTSWFGRRPGAAAADATSVVRQTWRARARARRDRCERAERICPLRRAPTTTRRVGNTPICAVKKRAGSERRGGICPSAGRHRTVGGRHPFLPPPATRKRQPVPPRPAASPAARGNVESVDVVLKQSVLRRRSARRSHEIQPQPCTSCPDSPARKRSSWPKVMDWRPHANCDHIKSTTTQYSIDPISPGAFSTMRQNKTVGCARLRCAGTGGGRRTLRPLAEHPATDGVMQIRGGDAGAVRAI